MGNEELYTPLNYLYLCLSVSEEIFTYTSEILTEAEQFLHDSKNSLILDKNKQTGVSNNYLKEDPATINVINDIKIELEPGVYNVPYKVIKTVGEEYQVVNRGREYHGCG